MQIGTVLGHYRVIDKLGEGGMGEVYRAEDERLKREVAIKVLPEDLSRDPERLARLQREAQMLAALEHPSIAAIHGLEESGGTRFLVMQLAEGTTLGDAIAEEPMRLEDALRVALQVAQGLEAAHERGIIHRDLKPGNIQVAADGTVKILDFGLAKAFSPEGNASSPELTASPTVLEATRAGVILGTAAYMSPEQARGKPVDRRTDIWAFGAVLFEMLTGARAFPGETATDVLGGIVHKEPDWELLPADTPRRILALLRRCLRKGADRRIQAIGDARVSIEEFLEDPVAAEAILDQPGIERAAWRSLLPWGIAAAAVLAALAGLWRSPADTAASGVLHMEMTVDVERDLREYSLGSTVEISPDGAYLVVAIGQTANAVSELRVRRLDSLGYSRLASDGAYHPFFSPDSAWVGYVTPSALLKVPTSGGTPQIITSLDRGRGATWAADDTIIYSAAPFGALWRVSANGGEPEELTTLDESRDEQTHRWPQILPDQRHVLFTAHSATQGDFDRATIDVVDLETGTRTTVHRGGSYARYVRSGHLVYANSGTLFAVPFDLGRLEVVGSAVPVVEELATDPASGGAQFTISGDGILVYRTGTSLTPVHPLAWVDRNGVAAAALAEPRTYAEPRISPDGTRIVTMEDTDGNWDIWVYDVGRGVRTRLTFAEGIEGPAVWSPDGQHLIFSSDRDGPDDLYRKRADGSGDIERLNEDTAAAYFVSDWSADGRYVIATRQGPEDADNGWEAGSGIGYLDLQEGERIEPFLSSEFNESEAALSPDGRWLAYQSNESGSVEVYVRPFPPGPGKWQVSDRGGAYARWAPDGSALYYRNDEGMVVADIDSTAGAFQASRPRQLFSGTFRGGYGGLLIAGSTFADYDVAPDGRFLMMPDPDRAEGPNIELAQVVINWFEELRRLAPTR